MTADTGRNDQRDIDALLQHLDQPVPVVDVGDIVARAGHQPQRWKFAAGVLLALAIAGGAYALPGSPFRNWFQSSGERRARTEVPATPPSSQTPARPAAAGIAVNPGRSLVIRFSAADAQSEARVWLVDSALVAVRSTSSAVTFTSDLDRLLVENANAPASFEVLIPQDAARVEIRVGEHRVFLKEGHRVETRGERLPEGSWLISLGPPPQSP